MAGNSCGTFITLGAVTATIMTFFRIFLFVIIIQTNLAFQCIVKCKRRDNELSECRFEGKGIICKLEGNICDRQIKYIVINDVLGDKVLDMSSCRQGHVRVEFLLDNDVVGCNQLKLKALQRITVKSQFTEKQCGFGK